MFRRMSVLSAFGLLAVASASFAETGSIGTVDELVNIAYRQPVDQPRTQVHLADELYQNETLETEADASMLVTFLDGTSLRLEGGSSVVLDQYVFDPSTANGTAVMNFGAGVFRFVTGGIDPEDVELETAAATIGVRGTILNIMVSNAGATVVDVIDGAAAVQPRSGGEELLVYKGQRAIVASADDHGVVTKIPGGLPQSQDAQALKAPEKEAPAEPEPEPEPEPTDNHSGQGDGSNPGGTGSNNGGQGNPNNSDHDKNKN
ncbi:MAG: FecR family protein [Dongiaceae bacterium]